MLPLIVFLLGQSSRPHWRYKERNFFCVARAERKAEDAPLELPPSGERIKTGAARLEQHMEKILRILAVCMAGSVLASTACADNTVSSKGDGVSPLAISLVPAVELPFDSWDVCLLRMNILAGQHHNVYAVDVGGIANLVSSEFGGIQCAGIMNSVTDRAIGLQAGLVNLAGIADGLQVGFFNRTESMCGLQVGCINYAYQASGLQIGLANVIADSTVMFMPIINFGF